MMADQVCTADLLSLVDLLELPEAASETSVVSSVQLQAGILAKFVDWLSKSGVVPSKADALAWLSAAIDQAFTAAKKPALNLLKPIVKQAVLALAGQLYDSLFNPAVSV